MIYGYKQLARPEDWKEIVGARKWRATRSAYELAHKWHGVRSMPVRVRESFESSNVGVFQSLRLDCLYVERPTFLDNLRAPSCTDIVAYCRSRDDRVVIVGVEGKAAEPFGKPVCEWITGSGTSEGRSREKRLQFLAGMLGVATRRESQLRYQLIHRTAAIIHEAALLDATAAVVLIHSFQERPEGNWLAFQAFLRHVGVEPTPKGTFTSPCLLGPRQKVETYVVWIPDEPVQPNRS